MSTDTLNHLNERLTMLRALEDGWWGPGTKRSSNAHLDFADSMLPFVSDIGQAVSLCSSDDGAVVFEIMIAPWEISVSIEDDSIYVVGDNVVTDELVEDTYPLNSDSFKRAVNKYAQA